MQVPNNFYKSTKPGQMSHFETLVNDISGRLGQFTADSSHCLIN